MKRAALRFRAGLPVLAVLCVSCAGPYDKPSTATYILGAIFILIGVILAYELFQSS